MREPKLSLHKASGQGRVRIGAKDFYLGDYHSAECRRRYHELLAKLAAGELEITKATPRRGRKPVTPVESDRLSCNGVLLRYWSHASSYYVGHNGQPTTELPIIKVSLRWVKDEFGTLPADQFGPAELKACRNAMLTKSKKPLTRTGVNKRVARIVRCWLWAVAEGLVPAERWQALKAVEGLKLGRTDAPEAKPVTAVLMADVEELLPTLSETVRRMVSLQLFTAARPGEICALRIGDIDRSGVVWRATLAHHKSAHHNKTRTLLFGPKAQGVLRESITLADPKRHVFLPPAAQHRGRGAQPKPRRCYTSAIYGEAVRDACEKLWPTRKRNPKAKGLSKEQVAANKSRHWHVHQLRHLTATLIRAEFALAAR